MPTSTLTTAASQLTSYLLGTGASLADAESSARTAAENNGLSAAISNTTATVDVMSVATGSIQLVNSAASVSPTAAALSNSSLFVAASELSTVVSPSLPVAGALLTAGGIITKEVILGESMTNADLLSLGGATVLACVAAGTGGLALGAVGAAAIIEGARTNTLYT